MIQSLNQAGITFSGILPLPLCCCWLFLLSRLLTSFPSFILKIESINGWQWQARNGRVEQMLSQSWGKAWRGRRECEVRWEVWSSLAISCDIIRCCSLLLLPFVGSWEFQLMGPPLILLSHTQCPCHHPPTLCLHLAVGGTAWPHLPSWGPI